MVWCSGDVLVAGSSLRGKSLSVKIEGKKQRSAVHVCCAGGAGLMYVSAGRVAVGVERAGAVVACRWPVTNKCLLGL